MRLVLGIILFFLYFSIYGEPSTVCTIQADNSASACKSGITTTNPGAREMQLAKCKTLWTTTYNKCTKNLNKNDESIGCDSRREDCGDSSPSVRTVPSLDTEGSTVMDESCRICMNNHGASQYCQAQCSGNTTRTESMFPNGSATPSVDEIYNPTRSDQAGSGGGSTNRASTSNLQDTPGGGIPSGGGGPSTNRGEQPTPPPREPNLNQNVINSKFASCFQKEDLADECCNLGNSEICVQGVPEGNSLLSQLTNMANGLKTTQGMQKQCNAVKNLQKTNLAFTVLARQECKNKKTACSSDCNDAYYSVSHIYSRECTGVEFHPSCQKLKEGLDEAKDSEQNCQGMSENGSHFVAGIAQDLSKIKVAQECEDALKAMSQDGEILSAVPLPTPAENSQTDCSLIVNRSHPSCIGDTFGKLGSRDLIDGLNNSSGIGGEPIGSAESSSESNSPPGFDPKTGKAIPGFDERLEAQYQARLDTFENQKNKLDSNLAKGSPSSGGSGLLGGGGGSGDFQPLPGAPGVSPHKSNLFKEATAQKGYSQSGKTWSSGRKVASLDDDDLNFGDIFSKLKKNSEKPRNLHNTNGFDLRSLFGSYMGQNIFEVGKNRWLFGANSELLYQFFKEGENKLNFPAIPLKRVEPNPEFPGLSYLKQNSEASKRYHCTNTKRLRKENILDVNLSPRKLEKRVESLNSWLIYNINRDQNCFNRKRVSGGVNANLFGKPLGFETFKKGDFFDHSFLKMSYHRGFRDDEKSPLWLFSNNTDEIIITMLVKRLDPAVDSLPTYRLFMDNFIYYRLPGGVQKRSLPVQVMNQTIKGHEWVDGLHYESEAEGYFTRYLSTVYKDRAILVAFNIKKEALKKYIHPMNRMIASFRLDSNFVPTEYMDEDLHMATLGKSSETITLGQAKKFPGEVKKSYLQYRERKRFISRATSFFFGLTCLLLAGGGYFFLRRKNKKEILIEKEKNKRPS